MYRHTETLAIYSRVATSFHLSIIHIFKVFYEDNRNVHSEDIIIYIILFHVFIDKKLIIYKSNPLYESLEQPHSVVKF